MSWCCTKNESEDLWQGFLCCRTACLESAADRLETLAFNCFIHKQTEEFSVSCCLHCEHCVNSGMRHRSDCRYCCCYSLPFSRWIGMCSCFLQLEKQHKLNELDIAVTLCLHQIEHVVNGAMPRNLSECLIFEAPALVKLRYRITELEQERIVQKHQHQYAGFQHFLTKICVETQDYIAVMHVLCSII